MRGWRLTRCCNLRLTISCRESLQEKRAAPNEGAARLIRALDSALRLERDERRPVGDDDVVQELYAEDLAGFLESLGDGDVVCGGLWVS